MKKNLTTSMIIYFVCQLFVSNLVLAQSIPPYVSPNGLVGWYSMTGNSSDESGNGNDGTVNGATLTTDRNGNPNSAYYFDGVDDYIEVLHNSTLDFSINNLMTISFWVDVESYPPGSFLDIIISKQSGSGVTQSGFNVSQNSTITLGLTVGSGSGNLQGVGVGLLPLSQWHHVTLVWNNTTCLSYLDGVLFDSLTCSQSIGTNTENLLFGKPNWSNINAQHFNGKLDDIGLWDRALTGQEVYTLFNTNCTKPGFVSLGTDRSTILCPDDSVKIFVVNPQDPGLSYQWYRNNSPISGANQNYYYATDFQKYKVKVSSGPGSQCERMSGLVQPTSESVPSVMITAQGSTSICQGDSVLLTANIVPGYNYQWVRYGVPISGGTSPTFYAKQGGNYKVQITKNGGCISVSSAIAVNITCRLANSEPVVEGISIYPNPASSNIAINFNDIGNEEPSMVELIDYSGKTIIFQVLDGKSYSHSLQVNSLPAGMYLIRIILDSGDTVEKKVIIQK